MNPKGSGDSLLSPDGWRGNWFAAAHRTATRYTATATWERVVPNHGGLHDLNITGEISSRRLRGTLDRGSDCHRGRRRADGSTDCLRSAGGPRGSDWPLGLSIRDLWQPVERLQIEGGVRLDYSRFGGGTPSARVGVRYALDQTGATVLKVGYGSFIGSLPLTVPAFGSHPERQTRDFEPASGSILGETVMRPSKLAPLRLPRALTTTVGLERQVLPGLDVQAVFTNRDSSRLATLDVPTQSGFLDVQSSGESHYTESAAISAAHVRA